MLLTLSGNGGRAARRWESAVGGGRGGTIANEAIQEKMQPWTECTLEDVQECGGVESWMGERENQCLRSGLRWGWKCQDGGTGVSTVEICTEYYRSWKYGTLRCPKTHRLMRSPKARSRVGLKLLQCYRTELYVLQTVVRCDAIMRFVHYSHHGERLTDHRV